MNGIPLEVIARGRDLEEVLDFYTQYEKYAEKLSPAKTMGERFADGMMAATYRLYLLGVEDGMYGR